MAISRVATTTAATTNTNTVTVNLPSGVVAGDLLIFALASNEGTFTRPSGLTLVAHETGADTTNSFSGQVYYKIAGGSEPSTYTWSITATAAPMCIVLSAWRGVDNTTPIHAGSVNADSGGDAIEPAPSGTSMNITLTGIARRIGVRMVRATTSPTPSFTMDTVGNTIDGQIGEWSGGTVRYATCFTSRDADNGAGSWPMAKTNINDDDETDNVYVHFALNPNPGVLPDAGGAAVTASANNTAFNYAPASLATVTAAAFGITSETGVAALPGTAEALATASGPQVSLTGIGEFGASAFNATVAVKTTTGYGAVTASTMNQTGYFGAPPSRSYRIAAEDRTQRIPHENRTYRVT